MVLLVQNTTDTVPVYVSSKMKEYFDHCITKHVLYLQPKHTTGIPHHHTGQTVIARSKSTLKDMLNTQKKVIKPPTVFLHCFINFKIL